ncbi:STAS domain-containing protein [Rhodococcus sp. NPDC003318]|uniref:STAS domain-containing protein n=1 Tax=Rhodococcus sp. NPDC003318 TaxID=3364503 RepID=UPI00367EAF97
MDSTPGPTHTGPGVHLVVDVEKPCAGYALVRVLGDLDVTTAAHLGSRLGECVVDPCTIVLDLREVPFVGCAALSVIDAAADFLHSRGERLVVICGPQARRALAVSGVDRRVAVLSV